MKKISTNKFIRYTLSIFALIYFSSNLFSQCGVTSPMGVGVPVPGTVTVNPASCAAVLNPSAMASTFQVTPNGCTGSTVYYDDDNDPTNAPPNMGRFFNWRQFGFVYYT